MAEVKAKGRLFLIPSTLGDSPLSYSIPSYSIQVIAHLKVFVVEEIRTARRFIKKAIPTYNIDEASFMLFNEHSDKADVSSYIKPLLSGVDVGLLSEAGIPCMADPGAEVVALAQQHKIQVIPLVGPSSIVLTLMASGFNGQNFAFHGYLPVDKVQRSKRLKELERAAYQWNQTQIFIETPYRNKALFDTIIESCNEQTRLCIGCNLTMEDEWVITKTLKQWKSTLPDIAKKPAVFLIYKG